MYGGKHATVRAMKLSLAEVEKWMQGHKSWRDAVSVAPMPYIGTRSDIMALELVKKISTVGLPPSIRRDLEKVKLSSLVEYKLRDPENQPNFWKGAKLDDPEWRRSFMRPAPSKFHMELPFNDDLNDLILTVLCERRTFCQDPAQIVAADNEQLRISEASA